MDRSPGMYASDALAMTYKTLGHNDDWTGKASSAERRKIQNRLNARAYRRRRQGCRPVQVSPATSDQLLHQVNAPCDTSHQGMAKSHNEPCQTLMSPELANTLETFANQTYLDNLRRTPCLDHLPTVVHINLLNAFAGNAAIFDMSQLWLICDAKSPFGSVSPRAPSRLLSDPQQEQQCWPPNMHPTHLQQTVPHHPWLDLFPLPALRDNMIRAILASDSPEELEDDLWLDMIEMRSGRRGPESPSLIFWGSHPWDVRGWEANETFLLKWGFLLQACGELLESTNHWRKLRGEKRIKL